MKEMYLRVCVKFFLLAWARISKTIYCGNSDSLVIESMLKKLVKINKVLTMYLLCNAGYMYGADMAWWLLNMLLRCESGRSYNLGSSKAITQKELSKKIKHLSGEKIEINHSRALLKSKPSIFVPSVELVQSEMGLGMKFDIDAALLRTIQWYAQPA